MACSCLDCTDITIPTGATGATGPAGPTGPTGPAGSTSPSILTNQFPALATLGVAYETLNNNAAGTARNAWVLPVNTLSSNFDEIVIMAVFTTNAYSSSNAKNTRIRFNGSSLNVGTSEWSLGSNISKLEYEIRLTRITSSTAKYTFKVQRYTYNQATGDWSDASYSQRVQSLAGLDFVNNTYNIEAQGDSSTIGDITCEQFKVLKYSI